jgi:hypothetical protein
VTSFTPGEFDLDWPWLLEPLKAHQDVPFETNLDVVALADARRFPRLHGEKQLTAIVNRPIHNKSIMEANLPVKGLHSLH